MTAAPGYFDDGNFTVGKQNGSPTYDFPFSYRGDFKTFVATVTMRVAVGSYQPPASMGQRIFPNLGRGYLVDFTEPTMVGQGLLEYKLQYASVPLSGYPEYGSCSYTVQTYTIGLSGSDDTLSGYNDTFNATYFFDYSLYKPLDQILKTRLILVPEPDTGTFPGRQQINIVGSRLEIQTARGMSGLVLAQNTTSKIYRGQIFERLSVYIRFVNPTPLLIVTPP